MKLQDGLSHRYGAEANKFKTAMIVGTTLFHLDTTKLQNDVKVFDVSARKEF